MPTPRMTRCCANWSRACAGDGRAAVGLACKSAITQARVRLGEAPLRELFRRVARPLAEPGTPGAWYRELRLVSFDGTTIDVPDLPALERDFGRPSSPRGVSGFPQLRLLALLETHPRDLRRRPRRGRDRRDHPGAPDRGPSQAGNAVPGRSRLRRLHPVARRAATGADLLWRARRIFPCLRRLDDGSFLSRLYPSSDHRRRDRLTVRVIEYRMPGVPGGDRIYRLVTTLLDDRVAPAAELAALYHERWEDETVLAERQGGDARRTADPALAT